MQVMKGTEALKYTIHSALMVMMLEVKEIRNDKISKVCLKCDSDSKLLLRIVSSMKIRNG